MLAQGSVYKAEKCFAHSFPTSLSNSLSCSVQWTLCVCAKQGTLTEGKNISGKEKKKDTMEKKYQWAILPLLGNGLQASEDLVERFLSISFRSWSPDTTWFSKRSILCCLCRPKQYWPQSPRETYRPSFKFDSWSSCIVLPVVAGFPSHLTANAHNSEGKKDGLMYIEIWILAELFSSHLKSISF